MSYLSFARFGSLMLGGAFFLASVPAFGQDWQKVYDGVDFVNNFDGVHAVRIETDLIGVSITPFVMDRSYQGKGATPMAWGKAKGLQVAFNTNFYNMKTITPLSIAVSDGDVWHNTNSIKDAQIGFTKDGRLKWERLSSTALAQPWMYNVVSGMGELLVDGQIPSDVLTSAACKELGHCKDNRSRTGFGVSQDKKYIYIAVSKGDGGNGGVKLDRFAAQMKALGSYYAVNLDGGGSSGLYIESHNKMYGTNTGRQVALNMGFKVIPRPDYVCKVADVDNPGAMIHDMDGTHWGIAAAEAMINHQMTSGCGSDPAHIMFCPDCGMKRMDAAVWVARSLGLEKVIPASPSFSDVTVETIGEDATGYIEALLQNHIISKADTFRPNDIVTRAESAVMIAAGFVPNVEAYQQAQNATFGDVPKEHWGFAHIEGLVRNCIVVGGDGQYLPDKAMTRVEFASILARAAQYIERDGCIFTKQCDENGKSVCDGNQIVSCIANESVTVACGSDELCVEGECRKDIPCDNTFEAVCEGQTLKQCILGKVAFETCEHACEKGQCVECLSTDKPWCKDGVASVCLNGRIQSNACQTGETCGKGGVCVSESGCEKDSYRCFGDYLFECNGSDWYEAFSCVSQNLVCMQGVCVPPAVCKAGETQCEGKQIRTCSELGQWGEPVSCGDHHACFQNQCVKDSSGGDEVVTPPDKPSDGDSNAYEVRSSSESSCSMGNRQNHTVPLLMLILGGFAAIVRRRRFDH